MDHKGLTKVRFLKLTPGLAQLALNAPGGLRVRM